MRSNTLNTLIYSEKMLFLYILFYCILQGSKLLLVFVCIYSSVHATPINQDEVQVQNSPLDVSAGRFVEVQNASLVITYTGIIVAIVMMASFLSIAAYYSTGEQYRNFKTKRSILHSGELF